MFLRRFELRRTGGLLSLSAKVDDPTEDCLSVAGAEEGGFSAMFISSEYSLTHRSATPRKRAK
jgi:hypothetical protein